MADDRLTTMQDSRHHYSAPPFPRQPQPAPGLAVKMPPHPEHGAASSTGSGKLVDRKALITGGDSGSGATSVSS